MAAGAEGADVTDPDHDSPARPADEIAERATRAAVARGDAVADVVFRDARIVNTFTGEIERADVALAAGRIAGVGDYRRAREVIDLGGRFLVPGLIDGHVHVESSFLVFPRYAQAVVPHGTLGIVTDLHEIANVAGVAGFAAMVEQSRGLPPDSFFLAPSCVPASEYERPGATVGLDEIGELLDTGLARGLGEVMDLDGVVGGDAAVHAKLAALDRGFARGAGPGWVADGHAPGLRGARLNAYLGAGPSSDHESVSLEEAREKLRRGAWLMIREGSSEHNLEDLLPLVSERVQSRCMLVVDDRSSADLVRDGDLDAVIRKAVRLGCDPITAIRLATINPATYFGLRWLGGIAPGYWANLLVVDDPRDFRPTDVYYRGRLVAREGAALFAARPVDVSGSLGDSVRLAPPPAVAFAPPILAGGRSPVIEVVPGQIVTRLAWAEPRVVDGRLAADPERDLLKLAICERHRGNGEMAVGLARGFGLRRGALASSLAHDAHNVLAVGVSDDDLALAVAEVVRMRGGLVCVADGVVRARLPLPIAGLLSTESAEVVAGALDALEAAARDLGCALPAPFAVLSFLALPVIPEARLTTSGVIDVATGTLVADSSGAGAEAPGS